MHDTDVAAAERLIAKWKGVTASELSTSQSFLIELCELPGVDRPMMFHTADGSQTGNPVDMYGCGRSTHASLAVASVRA